MKVKVIAIKKVHGQQDRARERTTNKRKDK